MGAYTHGVYNIHHLGKREAEADSQYVYHASTYAGYPYSSVYNNVYNTAGVYGANVYNTAGVYGAYPYYTTNAYTRFPYYNNVYNTAGVYGAPIYNTAGVYGRNVYNNVYGGWY